MSRKTIAKMSENPTKAEETQFLAAIRESLPTNSYLSIAFNADFQSWVVGQIFHDLSPDMFGELSFQMREKNTATDKVRELDTLVDSLRASNERLNAEIATRGELYREVLDTNQAQASQLEYQGDMIEEANEQIRTQTTATQIYKEDYEKADERFVEGLTKYRKQKVVMDGMAEEIDAAQQEILELKAKMFDMLQQIGL